MKVRKFNWTDVLLTVAAAVASTKWFDLWPLYYTGTQIWDVQIAFMIGMLVVSLGLTFSIEVHFESRVLVALELWRILIYNVLGWSLAMILGVYNVAWWIFALVLITLIVAMYVHTEELPFGVGLLCGAMLGIYLMILDRGWTVDSAPRVDEEEALIEQVDSEYDQVCAE